MNARRHEWIHSPGLDLLIGCGAWSLPLLILAYKFGGSNLPIWTMVFYALALVFNYPHYMATIYRAYHTKEDFQRYRVFTVHATVLLALVIIAAHASYRLVPWLFTIYVTWSPWHYMGQNFGLAIMFIHRNGTHIDRKDRNALWTAFVASYAMIFLSFHANPSTDPYVLSLGLPPLLDTLRLPLLGIFVVLGVWPLSKLVRHSGWRPMLPVLTLYATEFFWFVLPTLVELTTGYRVPQSRYSAGILAVMHSAQYIWITSYYARRESNLMGRSDWKWQSYFAALILGGIALFIPGPWLAGYLFGLDFGTSFLIITAIVNIHHFILDGAVWKLRESRIAALLIPKNQQEPQSIMGWTPKQGQGWHVVKVAATAGILVAAGIDQARHYLTTRVADSGSLMLASTLNPYDASLKSHLVHAYIAEGKPEMVEPALRESVRLNPYNADVQNRLAQLLVESERYEEAYEHYQRMAAYVTPDAAALTNYGILAVRRNRDEASQLFQRALLLNPRYGPAHLYYADILDAEGKTSEAIRHYEAYLALLASSPAEVTIKPENVLAPALKLGAAYTQTSQFDKALAIYQKSLEMVERTGDKKLQSVLLARTAQIHADSNQNAQAIAQYQRTLRLDAEIGDDRTTGTDWFMYGQFLSRINSKRLAFACYLQAEKLLKSTDAAPVVVGRKSLEAELGVEAVRIRANLESILAEALR